MQLTTAADTLAHGPYRRGTAAQRAAVTPLYDGLTWWQTDGEKGLWRVEAGAWRHLEPAWGRHFGNVPYGSINLSAPPAGARQIIQAGSHNSMSSSNAFGNAYFSTITFPTEFPGGLTSLVFTAHPTSANQPGALAYDRADKSGFRAVVFGQATQVQRSWSWVAVGY